MAAWSNLPQILLRRRLQLKVCPMSWCLEVSQIFKPIYSLSVSLTWVCLCFYKYMWISSCRHTFFFLETTNLALFYLLFFLSPHEGDIVLCFDSFLSCGYWKPVCIQKVPSLCCLSETEIGEIPEDYVELERICSPTELFKWEREMFSQRISHACVCRLKQVYRMRQQEHQQSHTFICKSNKNISISLCMCVPLFLFTCRLALWLKSYCFKTQPSGPFSGLKQKLRILQKKFQFASICLYVCFSTVE